MRLLVLDPFQSFSLVPYLKKAFPDWDILTMANLGSDRMWQIFCNVAPDVVFVDFCNENAVNLTKKVWELPKRPRIVIRLHGYEAQSWYMEHIQWHRVNDLIVVSPKFEEIVKSKITGVKINVVNNGIDLEKFQLTKQLNHYDVAYVGYLNKKKGPTLLRTIMASVPYRNFHVGGVHQDAQVKLYFDALNLPNVTYHGWVKTEEFLKDKGFILSTSVTESFGMSIAEGMAMGLTPAVHAWPGAELLWPKWCIWSTFNELGDIFNQPRRPEECRQWVEDRYSMDSCITKVTALLKG